MAAKSCTECGDTYYAKGYCVKHYFKSRRTTTRELIPEGAQCSTEGCERPVRAKMLCAYHYDRKRQGRTATSKVGQGRGRAKKEVVGYRAAHLRVEQLKGKAATHNCVCGKPAQEWALDPLATHTHKDEQGRVWSLNIDDYMPMCCKHHRLMDKQPDDWYVDLWMETK